MGLVRYLYSLPVVKENRLMFLSNNLHQDQLEQFFGFQRERGGTSDNSSVAKFIKNTQALRVADSFCCGPVRGNCTKEKGSDSHVDQENVPPLAKRPKPKKKMITYRLHTYL